VVPSGKNPAKGGYVIGTQISHYKIIEKLGHGGMGEVYLANDTKLKRKVALKFLPREYSLDSEARERFLREAQAASILDHPNICTIHEIGETEKGQSYIIMSFCEGETLREKIKRGTLKVEIAIDIAVHIARGISSAHKHDIIHRDIKPANIMINQDGVVKIVDFGLAKFSGVSELTQEHTTLGTIYYMSPEQVNGKEADQRSDIWAVGAVLYEMICGKAPFTGNYAQSIFYDILNAEIEPPVSVRRDVPEELEKIISKALMKDPEKRYQKMDEMLDELEAIREETKIGRTKRLHVNSNINYKRYVIYSV